MRIRILIISFLLLAAGVWPESDGTDSFLQAEKFYRENRLELALENYDAFLRRDPGSPRVADAQFRRAVILFRLERYEEAADLFSRIEIRYRSTRFYTGLPFWKGIVSYHLGKFEDADKNLEKYLSQKLLSDEREKALYYSALVKKALGDALKAKEILSQVFKNKTIEPEDGLMLVFYASLCRDLNDAKTLMSLNERISADTLGGPEKTSYLLILADVKLRSGNTHEALALYKRLESSSDESAVYAVMREIDISSGEGLWDTVLPTVERAEKRFSGKKELLSAVWKSAGLAFFHGDQRELAEYYLKRVWDLGEPSTIGEEVPLYLAELLRSRNRNTEACDILRAYRSADPKAHRVLLLLGELLAEEGKLEEAKSLLESFLGSSPGSEYFTRASYTHAWILYRLGMNEAALSSVNRIFQDGRAGDYEVRMLRLSAALLSKMGRNREALEKLREYLVFLPKNSEAGVDRLRLLFAEKMYAELKVEGEKILSEFPSLSAQQPLEYLTVSYLLGMSYLSTGDYSKAAEYLLQGTKAAAMDLKNGLYSEMNISGKFYLGWAYYRLGKYEESLAAFTDVAGRAERSSERHSVSLYYAAWAAFSLRRFEQTASLLGSFPESADDSLKASALFLRGAAFQAMERLAEAGEAYYRVFTSYPSSASADEAHFEYAGILLSSGDTEKAAQVYKTVFTLYPSRPLGETALFKRAEAYYAAKLYEKAKAAFYDYRTLVKNPKSADQALYWGGLASVQLKETYSAILLWESLIDQYRNSAFRPDSMRRTAELYAALGEYSRANREYLRFIDEYPRDAAVVDARKQVEELRLLMSGKTDKEASLSVRIGKAGGAESEEGRSAMLELARLYVYEGSGRPSAELAAPMLNELLLKEKEDPKRAAEAKYLLGELQRSRQKFSEATTLFLEAASMKGSDKDLVARSLLRAVDMLQLQGKTSEAAGIAGMLRKNYPDSEWSAEADRITGGRK